LSAWKAYGTYFVLLSFSLSLTLGVREKSRLATIVFRTARGMRDALRPASAVHDRESRDAAKVPPRHSTMSALPPSNSHPRVLTSAKNKPESRINWPTQPEASGGGPAGKLGFFDCFNYNSFPALCDNVCGLKHEFWSFGLGDILDNWCPLELFFINWENII